MKPLVAESRCGESSLALCDISEMDCIYRVTSDPDRDGGGDSRQLLFEVDSPRRRKMKNSINALKEQTLYCRTISRKSNNSARRSRSQSFRRKTAKTASFLQTGWGTQEMLMRNFWSTPKISRKNRQIESRGRNLEFPMRSPSSFPRPMLTRMSSIDASGDRTFLFGEFSRIEGISSSFGCQIAKIRFCNLSQWFSIPVSNDEDIASCWCRLEKIQFREFCKCFSISVENDWGHCFHQDKLHSSFLPTGWSSRPSILSHCGRGKEKIEFREFSDCLRNRDRRLVFWLFAAHRYSCGESGLPLSFEIPTCRDRRSASHPRKSISLSRWIIFSIITA